MNIYGVKFKSYGKTYYFNAKERHEINTSVVVETVRGNELAEVVSHVKKEDIVAIKGDMKQIVRKASQQDIDQHDKNESKASKYVIEIQEEIDKLGLDMRVVRCELTLDATKLVVIYVSEQRVDFRSLLKIINNKYKKRIELKQIGARDKAKMMGGLGVCGLPLCCSTFLGDFSVVSINMAKNQALALNIPKLSGACGKLMCCLKYENETYTELRKGFPKMNQQVFYEGERYKVTGMNILMRKVKIENPGNIQFIDLDLLGLK